MAKVDYYAIQEKIKDILIAASASFTAENTLVEESQPFSTEINPYVSIIGTGRDVPPEDQVIAMGSVLRVVFNVTINVYAFRLGFDGQNMKGAIEQRDDLIGEIETILMSDLSLGSTVEDVSLRGGLLESARDTDGYWAAGEVLLEIAVEATN